MKIALGVSGGIAAYKAAEIVRLLQDRGIRVQVVMTRAAQEFVRSLTFAALSGEKSLRPVRVEFEDAQANVESAIEHIAIAQAIDALVVSGNSRCAGQVCAGDCQRLPQHSLSCYDRSGGCRSRDERQYVESRGHPVECGNPAEARRSHCGARQRYLACGMTGAGGWPKTKRLSRR